MINSSISREFSINDINSNIHVVVIVEIMVEDYEIVLSWYYRIRVG